MKDWGYVPLVSVYFKRERDPALIRAANAKKAKEKTLLEESD